MSIFNTSISCVAGSKYPPCEECVCGDSANIVAGENIIVDVTPTETTISAGVVQVSQAGNIFTVGTAVYFDGALWQPAIATSFATSGTHIVSRSGDPNFRVVQTGVVDIGAPHGYPVGSLLYVSPTAPGVLTATNPTAPYFSNPIAIAVSANVVEVFSYLSEIGLPPSTIFLNPTIGNDGNDGLTALTPVLTLPAAISKFGTNTAGPGNRTATISVSVGTLTVPASATIDFSPLANIGFTEVMVVGTTVVARSGLVLTANNTSPSAQFTQITTDQVGMGVNAFRGMIMTNTTEDTDGVVETNTPTNFTLPDGRTGNIIFFRDSQAFSVVSLSTNFTWAGGSIFMRTTPSIRLTLRYLAITAAGAVSDQILFTQPSAQKNLGSPRVTVTGCSINTVAHTSVFNNGAELNIVGCLITGDGAVNPSENCTVRVMRVFITDAIVRPIAGTSGGIYALSQSNAISFEDGSRIFGCKIENGVGGTVSMVSITNSSVRVQGIQILGNTVNITSGIAISASTVTMNGVNINGNARLGVCMTIIRGSIVRIGFSPGGISNDFSNSRTDGIQVSHGSLLDSGTADAVTSTVINGTGFGIMFSSGSMGIFGIQPTITGASGNVSLGASGARTWAQVAGGLAADVNDFANASPQNVVVMVAA
ncbi:MAG TPA: hypothetical protein VLE02_01460 [Nitrosarchaeum sp.]|nr:hypothetical protein [Nitrosarchaeum sp.]